MDTEYFLVPSGQCGELLLHGQIILLQSFFQVYVFFQHLLQLIVHLLGIEVRAQQKALLE